MGSVLQIAIWIGAMAALMAASAFFSCSEAALFFLSRADRRQMAGGTRAQRLAVTLLSDPDRLLSAILFGNLLVNVSFFTLSSVFSLELRESGRIAEAGVLAVGSVMGLIVFSEMLPKCVGVLWTRRLAPIVAVPLSGVVRAADPLMPFLRTVNLLSRRLLFPRFHPEPYLRVRDLERAVELSLGSARQVEEEQRLLQAIVGLSDLRVDEIMRPRLHFEAYRPPVTLADVCQRPPVGDYLFVTEPDSDEIASAVPVSALPSLPAGDLVRLAQSVVYVPWSAAVAVALEAMQRQQRRVAAVINEQGETIGVLTFEDILGTIFSGPSGRASDRLVSRNPIRLQGPGVWHVSGMTSVRRLAKHFKVELPQGKSVTVAGILQEQLERFPRRDDETRWGPLHLRVLDAPERGQLLVELRLSEEVAP